VRGIALTAAGSSAWIGAAVGSQCLVWMLERRLAGDPAPVMVGAMIAVVSLAFNLLWLWVLRLDQRMPPAERAGDVTVEQPLARPPGKETWRLLTLVTILLVFPLVILSHLGSASWARVVARLKLLVVAPAIAGTCLVALRVLRRWRDSRSAT
jgi:hypothetical protein